MRCFSKYLNCPLCRRSIHHVLFCDAVLALCSTLSLIRLKVIGETFWWSFIVMFLVFYLLISALANIVPSLIV